jgi:translation elongation factor EF-Tu-like GTPase
MTERVPFALTLEVDLHLLSPEQGGVKTPVSSGYRPLCQFAIDDGKTQTVGMCQLELVDAEQVHPGGSARGLLRFAEGVAEIVKVIAHVGSDVALVEGARVIGSARVTAIA